MQQRTQERVEYAGLGARFAATVIDMIIVFFLLVAALMLAVVIGALDLAQYSEVTWPPEQDVPGWVYLLAYGLVFVYFAIFEQRGGTPGKRALHLTVVMDDGSPPTASAIMVRNLVRIPELILYYIPSGISCLVSAKNKRLGDYAARTVVVRVGGLPAGAATAGRAASPAHPPGVAVQISAPGYVPPVKLGVEDAIAALKTAALAVRGAHLYYLRFSAVELAKEAAGEPAGGPDGEPAPDPEYSPEYSAAWYTLTDAVMVLHQARAAADGAAAAAAVTLQDACAGQPDLVHLFRELEPYFTASSDEQVHEAYMRVARDETA